MFPYRARHPSVQAGLFRSETMAEAEGTFSRGRLEAFSDGVIAVIITIMVLELKPPESAEPGELVKVWPGFAIYAISFVYVAIYWINHHGLLAMASRVDAGVIWTNNLLLLSLSLIPFATAYVAQTSLAPFPTFIYGALQFVCGASFSLLLEAILAARRSEPAFLAVAAGLRKKGALSLCAYAAGTGLALINPTAAMALFIVVAGAYVLPDLFAKRREG
jgi:uncharacterized membrane protein